MLIKKIIRYLNDIGLFKGEDDEQHLKKRYRKIFGEELNFDNPRTFNEKMQWLKLNDRNPLYTKLVDKYEVKKYVSEIIGKEYIIPTLGVYNKFDEIDFEKLPNQFVMKCTHDSGGVYICKDKCKINYWIKLKIRIRFNLMLKRNYYYRNREWPYKNVKPRIIIEKYMTDESKKELKDYKFFCFNGRVEYMKVDFNREIEHRANYYDRNFKIQEFGEEICPPDFNKKIKKPLNYNKMVELAEILSKDITFVRIDLLGLEYTKKKTSWYDNAISKIQEANKNELKNTEVFKSLQTE